MKISLTIMAVIGLVHLANAQDLPESAKLVLDKLAKYEERQYKLTEAEVVKKKRELINELERSKKRIESKGIIRLYDRQIKDLEKEIARSERIINGDRAELIVDYDVVYHYSHPGEGLTEQKGELTFYGNRKVKLRHINVDGQTAFEHVINWKLKDEKLIILDEVHGEMIVSQKMLNNRDELSIEWTKLDKTISAKVDR